MKILVACEESGRVTEAFRNKGHEAYSCDIKPTSGNLPQYHYQENVLNLLNREKWDMLIAFPPCTYFSKMNFLNYYRRGEFNEKRFEKAKPYIELFNNLWNADIEKICIENPVPMKLFKDILPPYTMTLQPYEFGENYSKKTYLWLKNLPPLIPTCLNINHKPLITTSNSFKIEKSIEKQSERRSKTPVSIAEAMANQWNF